MLMNPDGSVALVMRVCMCSGFNCRALGHGAFGEVYEGQVIGMNGDNAAMQVAIKVSITHVCCYQSVICF